MGSDAFELSFDVVIIGGGLSGSLAAILLGRTGLRVTLIDSRAVYPPEFRAERLVGVQLEMLRRLGLFDVLIQDAIAAERAVATRAGKIVEVVTAPHYGVLYDGIVNRARAHLPASVRFINDKAEDIRLTADRQSVTLSNGDIIDGRLIVMATGSGQRLMRQLGISRTLIRRAHSNSFGFDIELESLEALRSSWLIAYGEKAEGAIDYLSLFLIGEKLRANLFSYGDYRDVWAKQLVREPIEILRQALPHLERMTGNMRASGAVQVRVVDLTVASDHLRDGMVLIGDAFQTTCPATGTGVTRVLNDIDRLCNVYIPQWLATEGMDSGKISQFYADPVKAECDAGCSRAAEYRRSFVTATGIRWKIHRQRVLMQRQLRSLTQHKPNFKPV